MPMMKNVLGLDVGSHTIKAVELRQTFRGLEPVQLRLHPRADPDAPLEEVLRRFLRMHQLPTDHVVSALPGDRLSVRRMEFPFRDRKRLASAVPFEVEAETPFQIEDIVVDWEPVAGERSHAVLAVAIAQRREVAERIAALENAGAEPRILEAEGLALANLASVFELGGTRMLIDIGHRKTTLCVLSDGSAIASRTVPVGGRHLTEAIAQDRHIPLEDAEHSKCEDGIFHTQLTSPLASAQRLLDRIAREIVRTLESVEPAIGGSSVTQVAGLTLMGGGGKLHRLDEYLSERTGVPTTRLSIPPDNENASLVAGGDPMLFGPAIALALRGTARARTHTDFRQEEFSYRTDFSRLLGADLRPTAIISGVALFLLLASAGTSISIESRRADQVESEVARLYSEVLPDQPVPANPVAALRNELRSARERADLLGVYGGNHSALDLLGELSRRVPKDLEVRIDELTVSGPVVRLKVLGQNFEAAERLTAAIAASPPFQAAEVKGGVERTTTGTSFTVSISLSGADEEEAR